MPAADDRLRPGDPDVPRISLWRVSLLVAGILAFITLLLVLPLPSLWPPSTPRETRNPASGKTAPPLSINHLPSQYVPDTPPAPPPQPVRAAGQDTHEIDALRQQVQDQALQLAALQQMLDAQNAAAARSASKPDAAAVQAQQRQNDLAEKRREEQKKRREAFAKAEPIFYAKAPEKEGAPGSLRRLRSPYGLAPTEEIPCQTRMTISSETPGSFIAEVSSDVMDSATRQYVVIPRGSRILMKPTGRLLFGDSRIPVEAKLIRFPNADWVKLGHGSVTDAIGTAGFTGQVDRHWGRLLGSVVILGVLRGGTSAMAIGSGDIGEKIGGAVAQDAASEGSRQARQYLRTEPTITVETGYACKILLEEPLELDRPYLP